MRDIPQLPDNAPQAKIERADYSRWGKINKNLLCQIYTVDKDGNKRGDYIVEAAITEGSLELASQYSSPFDANPDVRLPTLMGMIQSGEAVSAIGGIASALVPKDGILGAAFNGIADLAKSTGATDGIKKIGETLQGLEGKTNLTKINSIQIFNSTQPVRLSITLFFRAWENAKTEVEAPLSLLEQWALPAYIADKTILEGVAKDGILAGLFPSTAPPFVAINYAGRTYLPFLIESISSPLVVERDSNLNRLAATVTLSLVSRAAWDAGDIRKLYGY